MTGSGAAIRYNNLMCGIIGYAGGSEAAPLLIEGLQRLEYRGYDSAGIAVQGDGALQLVRNKGKVSELEARVQATPVPGHTGIAHTRWATHGEPEERNAHPHRCGSIAVVHNGIIENYAELKDALQARGATFHSDTDSEVICVWLHYATTQDGMTMAEAFASIQDVLNGSYAMAAMTEAEPGTIYAARNGSPLVIGIDEDEHWLASDTLALAGCVTKGLFLQDGDSAILSRDQVTVYHDGQPTEHPVTAFHTESQAHDKGGYPHFMLKEIHEQPDVIRRTVQHYYHPNGGTFTFDGIQLALDAIPAITIVACGTSYYAAQVASYWFEQVAGIPVRIDIASEFRYRRPVLDSNSVAMFISQSGETADTLAAMRYAKEQGLHTMAMVNVVTSTMAREADSVIQTLAGPEIGVASTKAFTAQLTTFACLTLALAEARGAIAADRCAALLHGLTDVADKVDSVLAEASHYDTLALALMYARDMLFIGRGTSYPLANEGALKMKEISYIHAEGYAAGELKHGPIALVDDGVPIIVVAPDDALFDKSASNLEETAARKGNIVLISSRERIASFKGNMTHSAALPDCDPFHAPILYAVPLQLLSYYVALHKGADIDQPRNLAKSVTVE